jgi:hypothetical protein
MGQSEPVLAQFTSLSTEVVTKPSFRIHYPCVLSLS